MNNYANAGRRVSVSLLGVLMTVMMMVSSSEVLAQGSALKPPSTKEAPGGPKFIVLGVAVLLLGLVIFVATLKSKRGHQD